MDDSALGLRERKKQRTRETIVRHAHELFLDRGFEATTVADIARAADIAPRTFFGYFPTKEDVVFDDFEEAYEELAECLRSRAPNETAFDALRAWIVGVLATGKLESAAHRCRRRLIRETPALAGRDRANAAQMEALLAEAVAQDLGLDREALRPHLVGAAAVAALDALGRHAEAEHALLAGAVDPLPVLDEALVFLQGGLDALRRRPAVTT